MRRSCNGGITPRGCRAIQCEVMFQGIRYRPSLRRTPTEANLRRAREHLAAIKERVAAGSFHFDEEFPNCRRLAAVMSTPSQRTCSHVFEAFLSHCFSLQQKGGMEAVTVAGYKRILDGIWRPTIGHRNFSAGHSLRARQHRRFACLEPEDLQQRDQRAACGFRVWLSRSSSAPQSGVDAEVRTHSQARSGDRSVPNR